MELSNTQFSSGTIDGKPWICGNIPMGKNRTVYIDTRTGEGVGETCELLKNFISYQSTKLNFPCMGHEDNMQDLYVLAVEAIPKYDITRCANMLTFLQGHIKNRLINKCKFVSEKKRRATFSGIDAYKLRCPSCRKMFMSDNANPSTCKLCDFDTASDKTKRWKKYNMPVLTIPFSSIEGSMPDGDGSFPELISEAGSLATLLGESYRTIDDEVGVKLDFMRIFDKLDDTNKTILSMLIEGYPYKEIADEIGMSEKAAYARVSKIVNSHRS